MNDFFTNLEKQNGLPQGFLNAVMTQESGGNPNAVSPKGALGAFQFMPATAQQYGIDPMNPQQAADGAARMYGYLFKKYNGDVPSALAAYNWGQGNLDRKGMQNAPAETQNYISKITQALPQQEQTVTSAEQSQDLSHMSDEELQKIAGSTDQAPTDDLSHLSNEELMKIAGTQPEAKEPGILDRIGADYTKRAGKAQEAADAYQAGKQSLPETALQITGNGVAGMANDVVGEGFKAAAPLVEAASQAIIPGYPLLKKGQEYVSSAVKNGPIGDLARSALSKYGEFEKNNPRAGRNIDALANTGAYVAALTPIAEQSAVGFAKDAATPIVNKTGSALKAITSPIHSPIETATKTATGLNSLTDAIAGGISNKVNRANLPQELKGLSNADALFVRSLKDEGIDTGTALKDYANAKELGAKPSIAVTSNIPSMQTQAYLTSKGSAGSKVAADAIKEIDNIQIPSLNRQIINKATGSGALSAEEYGKRVSSEAKKVFDQKIEMLQTRAKPYYEQSIGLDKSVPIDSPEMKAAMANRKVADALQTYRTDPNTLTNVQDDLKKFGIDGGELEKLPYNSTVALHAARTNLREQADAAFRSGQTGVFKATKSAINAIDNAIESAYPSYKYARKIYSKDAGALRALEDSPMAKMASIADGNYSKVANELMSKDAGYIQKFIGGLEKSGADPQKMRDSLAGAFLRSQLDNAGNDARRFSDSVFRNDANKMRLKALVGNQRFDQMAKVDTVIGHLLQTRNIPAQSITMAAKSMQEGVSNIPLSKAGIIDSVRKKIAPSLFEMVQKDPAQAARYNQLLFTDEGYKLLEHLSKGKTATDADIRNIGKFLNKQAEPVKTK